MKKMLHAVALFFHLLGGDLPPQSGILIDPSRVSLRTALLLITRQGALAPTRESR